MIDKPSIFQRAVNVCGYAGMAACCLVAGSVHADGLRETVDSRFSGSSYASNDIDVNNDLEGGSQTLLEGQTRRENDAGGRRFQLHAESDVLPWDGESFCDFDDDGNPVAVTLYYVHSTFVQRFSNRALLYGVMSNSPASTVCFNFIDNTYDLTIYYDIAGGEGRYEGATGSLVGTASGTQTSLTLSGMTGRMQGHVLRARR